MVFESGAVIKDGRIDVIIPYYEGEWATIDGVNRGTEPNGKIYGRY